MERDHDPILEVLDARARAHALKDDSFGFDDDGPPKTSRNVSSPAEATSAPTAAIVKVAFDQDDLDCVRDDRGVWVSVRRVCEALGLDPRAQQRRLNDPLRAPWACEAVTALHVADASGRVQEQTFVHLDIVPMVLATVDVSRVAEASRPKLVRYQRECARVLRDHFFPVAPAPLPPAPVDHERQELGRLAIGIVDDAYYAKLLDAAGAALRKASILKTFFGVDVLAVDPGVAFAAFPEAPQTSTPTALSGPPIRSLEGTDSATTVGRPYGISGLKTNQIARENAIYGAEPYGT